MTIKIDEKFLIGAVILIGVLVLVAVVNLFAVLALFVGLIFGYSLRPRLEVTIRSIFKTGSKDQKIKDLEAKIKKLEKDLKKRGEVG